MKLATRLFVTTSALVAGTALGVVVATDRVLRQRLEAEITEDLEREARLVAAVIAADSTRWPEMAQELGRRIGRRITLVDAAGRVRGDTDFDRPALAHLENHGARPEIRAARATGTGVDRRRSASTNERQMYVAVRGGPAGLVVVRVSASLVAVDRQVSAVQRAVAGIGLVAVLAAALLAWPLSGALARPLAQLTDAARRITAGGEPVFPDSRVPEIADHILALRSMAAELAHRFDALRREREGAGTVMESMTDGVIAAGADGTILTCNRAARRILGYGDEATLPSLPELFHDKGARDLLRGVLAGEEVDQATLHVGDREVLVTARLVSTGGLALVLRDVTTLRRLEAVRRDFVANVSHELKTPLTSIAGYAETLAAEPGLDAQARGFTSTILKNAHRMQRLVDDLLDLSRIESGGWRPERQLVELGPAVAEAWSVLAERAAAVGVRFEANLAPAAQALRVEPDALRQILTNLFDNAVRHTPAGGLVQLSAEVTGRGVTLAVRDTGTGIPPEHLPRVFERFYRVDRGRSREQGGTGLGLAIVKHLVEAHGGRVEAESAVGQGTTVRLTFPPDVLRP